MASIAGTQIGDDGKRYPIGDLRLTARNGRGNAVDPERDVPVRRFAPGLSASHEVSDMEAVTVSSGLPRVVGVQTPSEPSEPSEPSPDLLTSAASVVEGSIRDVTAWLDAQPDRASAAAAIAQAEQTRDRPRAGVMNLVT